MSAAENKQLMQEIFARVEMTSKEGIPYNNHYCLICRLRDRVLGPIPREQHVLMTRRFRRISRHSREMPGHAAVP